MSTGYEKGDGLWQCEWNYGASDCQRVFASTDTWGQDIRCTLMVPLWRHDLHWNKIHNFFLVMLSLTFLVGIYVHTGFTERHNLGFLGVYWY
jgi:hypothetical protein